jgi:hypothetical protein
MFRRYPLFQRLISWSKPYAPAERGTRPYEWFDWNSLLAEEAAHQAFIPEFMDGTSYFPSREEMAHGLAAFAERARVEVRYQTRWEATRRRGDDFVLITTGRPAANSGSSGGMVVAHGAEPAGDDSQERDGNLRAALQQPGEIPRGER